MALTVEGDADEGAAEEPPDRSLDDKAENGPPEGVGLQAEPHSLAIGFLSAKTNADGSECGDEAGIRVATEEQADDETNHRSGDHGAKRAAPNRAAQSPAERHGDRTQEAPVPDTACSGHR